jgi:hypothetical protein
MYNLKNYYLLTFQTTTQLLKAVKELADSNVECLIVPTPRILSKSCSESIKIKEEDIINIKYNCKVDHFINNEHMLGSTVQWTQGGIKSSNTMN